MKFKVDFARLLNVHGDNSDVIDHRKFLESIDIRHGIE